MKTARWLALLVLAVASGCSAQAKSSSFYTALSWQAPVSSPDPVAGYNVYAALVPAGSYLLLNAVPLASTTLAYDDYTISPGLAYDYYVESVDASGVESAPSNIASVEVPSLPPAPQAPAVEFHP